MKRSYLIEVDGEFFEVANGKEASDLLDMVVETAGEKEVVIEVVEPPRISVRTATNKPTKSKKLLDKVEETKAKVLAIYERKAAEIQQQRELDKEISERMLKKIAKEDEDAVIVQLIM